MLEEYYKTLARKVFKSSLSGALTIGPNDPLTTRISPPRSAFTGIDATSATFSKSKQGVLERIQERGGIPVKDDNASRESLLHEITFHDKVTADEVIRSLRVFGVAIFPSLFKGEKLSRLREEFNLFMARGQSLAYSSTREGESGSNSIAFDFKRSKLTKRNFPEIYKLFGSKILYDISKSYFAGQDFDFNSDMFIQVTSQTKQPLSGDLHWDKQLTLKSWIYVSEATEGYGAMRAALGSAGWTRYSREDAMFDGVPYSQIDNKIQCPDDNIISTGGPAGTFFIFVTDTGHGATAVGPGKTREIIRSEARPTRIKDWAAWANR